MTEEQLRKALREVPPEVWVHAMERLFSDRFAGGGYELIPAPARLRLLCAWKDLKDADSELSP